MNTVLELTMTEALEVVTLETLEAKRAEARENMEAAWDAQSKTTLDDGYSTEAAQAAINQAQAAQRHYYAICAQLEAIYTSLLLEDFQNEPNTDEEEYSSDLRVSLPLPL